MRKQWDEIKALTPDQYRELTKKCTDLDQSQDVVTDKEDNKK